MSLRLEAVPMGAQVSMLVARCPDCNHPQSFHFNSICSNANCTCRRVFNPEPDAASAKSRARLQRQGG